MRYKTLISCAVRESPNMNSKVIDFIKEDTEIKILNITHGGNVAKIKQGFISYNKKDYKEIKKKKRESNEESKEGRNKENKTNNK